MTLLGFRPEDAPALAALSAQCARGETDFVLNPLWENDRELFAEFERLGIAPEDHIRVAVSGDGHVAGCVGFLRQPDAASAGLLCPIVEREERGRGLGGELLRAGMSHGRDKLGIQLVSAAVGVRNRAGYSLLTATGFRPARQHYLMCCPSRPKATRPPLKGIEFGEARPEDADAILEIYRSCGFAPRSLETMQSVLDDRRHSHAVARQGERIVAFAEIETHWPTRPWVAFVGVTRELRDRGLGSSLVGWTVGRAFVEGAKTALLMLSPANRTALRAYEKVGFRRHRLVDVLEKLL